MYGNNCIHMVFLIIIEDFICCISFTTSLEDVFLHAETEAEMLPFLQIGRIIG